MTDPTSSSSETPDDSNTSLPNESDDSLAGGGWTASGEDLPELEELTPELAEEEAIRGDFMLRGAAILLAILFAWAQVGDSKVLVHIRSGEYMRANGFLPPRTDVHSFANEGQSSANVSWLFDHLVSVVWSMGGPLGLTVFKAFIAGLIAWLLSRISVPGLPTWWSSICGVIALGACASDLMPVTDLMTLLGVVLMLRMLNHAFEGHDSGLMWKAPLLIALWANLDPHAWIGVIGLALFSAGRTVASVPGDTRPGVAPGTLWAATAVSAIALLINPFPVASALSVVQTYFVEYPAMRALYPVNPATVGLLDGRIDYYSLFNVDAWGGFEFSYVAAIMVIIFGAVAIVLSRDRREAPWAFLLAGFGALAIISIHELSVAALVAAAAAGTVGQRWYQKTFPQEYTVKPSEVLFSRAGRAVTVLSFALLGFLVVTDRLPTRTVLGRGFTSDLQTTIDALDRQFQELPDDARVLHTRVDTGDFLIWSHRKSFVDSRILPFGSPTSADSVTSRFRTLRQGAVDAGLALADANAAAAQAAIVAAQQENEDVSTANDSEADSSELDTASGNTASGEQAAAINEKVHGLLEEAGITHAVAGLYPPGRPHIRSMGAFSSDPESWTLTGIESSAAVFAYTRNIPEADRPDKFDPVERSFRVVEPKDMQRVEFAREKGFYSQYLYRTRPTIPEDLRLARNYLNLRTTPETVMVAIRAANHLVAKDDQNAEGFHMLAMAYSRLASWEAQVARQTGGQHAADMRYMQVLMAARQAVTIDPELTAVWELLHQMYAERGRVDQSLECLNMAIPHMEKALRSQLGDNQEALDQLYAARTALEQRVAEIELQCDEALSQEPPADPAQQVARKHAIAEQVATMGHIGLALKLLQENQEGLKQVPQLFARAEAMRGQLLLETGALQEGYELFNQLNAMAEKETDGKAVALPWTVMSFLSKVALGSYAHASDEMSEYISQLRRSSLGGSTATRALATMPLVCSLENTVQSSLVTQWPVLHLASFQSPMEALPQAQAMPQFILAMTELEAGNVDAARVTLQGVVTECGESPYRPLAAAYLSLLRDDLRDFLTENTISTWETWPEEDFADLDAAETTTDDDSSKDESTEGDSESEEAASGDSSAESPASVESDADESESTEATEGEPDTDAAPADEPVKDESAVEESSSPADPSAAEKGS